MARRSASSERSFRWIVLACFISIAVLVPSDRAAAQTSCEIDKLLASDAAANDEFGTVVSVSGDVAVIGAWKDDDNGADSGSAYVFRYDGTGWLDEQKLLASDGSAMDWFGYAVAVMGDVAVIGAQLDNDNGPSSGSAYVFRHDGTSWVQEQKLIASDGAAGDRFGNVVSVSGDVVLITALFDDNNGDGSGSVYVFRYDGTTWIEEQLLLASDGAMNDGFGLSISVSGDVAVVGARNDDDNGAESGSAYMFRYDGTSWNEEQKVTASDGAAGDNFGLSASVSGSVAAIGALNDDDSGASSGSAYVYRYDGTNWIEEQKLVASDGSMGDQFGFAISVSGDVAVVGARFDDDDGTSSGSAYVFRYDGMSWSEAEKLTASDGAATDNFGQSVSVSGDVALVGSPFDDDTPSNSGSAYIFGLAGGLDCNGNGVTDICDISLGTSLDADVDFVPDECAALPCEVDKLLASDGAEFDEFGESVSVDGNVAVIGARFDGDNGISSGSAYVYRYDGTSWPQEQKLIASGVSNGDRFGSAVSVSGDVAMVGAPFDDDICCDSGAVYVYRYDGTSWAEEQKLLPSDGAGSEWFGASVAVMGDVAVIGAERDDDNGTSSGSAYVFRYDGLDWVEEQKLLASNGATGDDFAGSVSVSGDVAVVGSALSNSFLGSAYVFRYDGMSWSEEAQLIASDGAAGDRFGYSVSVSGDAIVIGAHNHGGTFSTTGTAYVFRYDGTTWNEEQKLLASDGQPPESFGFSVAVKGDVAIIGNPGDSDNGGGSGSAYVFRYNGATWDEEPKLVASDGAAVDRFGHFVSVSGDVAVIGALNHDANGSNSGSAYIVGLPGGADCNGNGRSDVCDISDGTSSDTDADLFPDECQPVAIGSVSCLLNGIDVDLSWTNGDVYSSVEVHRDGNLIATLAGSPTTYTDVDPGPGSYTYEVRGLGDAPSNSPASCSAMVPDFFPPPSDLSCSAMGTSVQLSWTNNGGYDLIRIFRNGIEIAEIRGDDTVFVDNDGLPESSLYEVVGGNISIVSTAVSCLVDLGSFFIRGDCNADGVIDIGDATLLLGLLFNSGATPLCLDACDCNDDGALDIGDVICGLGVVFGAAASMPPTPFPGCGIDPTDEDGLDCDATASSCL